MFPETRGFNRGVVHAANVLDGGRTIDEVPEVIRPQVEKILGVSTSTDTSTASTTTDTTTPQA